MSDAQVDSICQAVILCAMWAAIIVLIIRRPR